MSASNHEYKNNTASRGAIQNIVRDVHIVFPNTWGKGTTAIMIALLIITVIAVPSITVPVYLKTHPSSDSSNTAPAMTPTPVSSTTSSASETFLTGSPSPVPSVSTPASSKATLPPPPKPSADGVRLVNSLNGTTEGSGYAYFASAVDGNNGAQPSDYAVATSNVYTHWENQNKTGYFSDTKITFWVFINSTNAAVNAAVGEASNGYRTFSCYKDDGRLLYQQDRSDFYSIYYCQ